MSSPGALSRAAVWAIVGYGAYWMHLERFATVK